MIEKSHRPCYDVKKCSLVGKLEEAYEYGSKNCR